MADTANPPEVTDTIVPYLTVKDPDALMDFLKTVFDATLVKENRHADNTLQHARMAIGNSLIMMNEASETYPPNVSQLHVLVEDCDAVYALSLKWGATSIMAPNLRPHGDRMAGIKDLCGNLWWIASHPTSDRAG